MGRVVAVERLPHLTGTLTDNAVVRADGTGAVQGSNWTIDDTDALRVSGGSISNDDVAADLTVGSARDLGLTGDRDAWLTSDGTTTISGTTTVAISGGDVTITGTDDVTISGSLSAGGLATLSAYSAIVEGTESADLTVDSSSVSVTATSITLSPEGGAGTLALNAGNYTFGDDALFRSSLSFLQAYPWAGDVTITDTTLTDVWVSALSIPLGGRYAIIGSMSVNSPAADDILLQWTTTGTVTCAVGYVAPAGSMSGLPENTLSSLIATTGATQRITFFGTVDGGASGGTIMLQVRKNADAAGTDTTVYSTGTGFALVPIA